LRSLGETETEARVRLGVSLREVLATLYSFMGTGYLLSLTRPQGFLGDPA
jgi:hypothetical protein